MTNHWIDIGNSDCILVIGSNAAENHPISCRWITRAKEKGATVICVDPRFTRTAAIADIYAALRSGTDIAFIGGIIKYILDGEHYHRDYIVQHTNAGFLINADFQTATDLDGIFSGFENERYNKSTWKYQLDADGLPKKDPTLQNPNCVFQLLRKHYSRYDVDTVCKITGTDHEKYARICEEIASTGAPDRAATIMYAMGTTQHTCGTQNVRSYAILQLLLGNIGVAGGGINALRGHSNVQGSTDHALLFHILPGYLKTPRAGQTSLKSYLDAYTPKSPDPKSYNWWQHYPKYAVSLLKAWYGESARPDNDFRYAHLPKIDPGKNYSHIALFEAMYAGDIKGLMVWGQNPAVAGPNATMERKALENLDWMVAVDIFETETASFWRAPGVDSEKIKTEVFLLPAAGFIEKSGSITNSGRWMQWRSKIVDPPEDARDDLKIVSDLFLTLRHLYATEGGPGSAAITELTWEYGAAGGDGLISQPDAELVAREINGRALGDNVAKKGKTLARGELVPNFTWLRDDGSTSSGNWLYSASYTEEGNMSARRGKEDASGIGLYSDWAWCWPLNRRILYSRASCDSQGRPWNPARPVIRWDEGRWIGDVPDGGAPPGAKHAFIMKPEGHARLFALGLSDGPLPEHYEPAESPVPNYLSSRQMNPVIRRWDRTGSDMSRLALFGSPEAERYPIVATTYRLTEHFLSGTMTRNLPYLAELSPAMFVEISRELAAAKGISPGDRVRITSLRAPEGIEAYALVTGRFRPFKINGDVVHQIGLPFHFGFRGLVTGASANDLTPHIGDANTEIQESKAFLCGVEKA